jgi:hypothetical protein
MLSGFLDEVGTTEEPTIFSNEAGPFNEIPFHSGGYVVEIKSAKTNSRSKQSIVNAHFGG